MAGPVKFADLNKDAKDLLTKNFHHGSIKIEGKTAGLSGVGFTADACHDLKSGGVNAGLELKMKKIPLTEKWNSDGSIKSTLTSDGCMVPGLKTDLETGFHPNKGLTGAKIKTAYKKDMVQITADSDVSMSPVIDASAVVAHKGFLVGGQASFDAGSKGLKSTSVAAAFKGEDYTLFSGIDNFTKFTGSAFHKVSSSLCAGAQVGWTSSGGDPTLAVAVKHAPSADAFIKAKLDNNLMLGCSYSTKLQEGAQLTVSSLINAKALNGGGHQVGLALDLSA